MTLAHRQLRLYTTERQNYQILKKDAKPWFGGSHAWFGGHAARVNGHAAQSNGHAARVNGHAAQSNGHAARVNGHARRVNGDAPRVNETESHDENRAPRVKNCNYLIKKNFLLVKN